MDIIFLRDFRLDLTIGIHEWEKMAPQTVQLDLEIGLPHSRAGETDHVEDTIDYAQVVGRIRDLAAHRAFGLVEALAENIAALLLHEFHSPWVRVSVAKLGLMRGVRQTGVIIERGTRADAKLPR
ncbi:MAG: dihydroneopterin aldolase [Betaproteobacteria bacterium]|nr:dihydroneopterin aldolase [Betaproteobacteria bacterium]